MNFYFDHKRNVLALQTSRRNQMRPHLRPDGIPTRNDEFYLTAAEKVINSAIEAVEALGASSALTEAVVLLVKARDRVADAVENREPSDTR